MEYDSRDIERLGLRIEQEVKRFTWNVKIEYKSLLNGEHAEIKNRLDL